MSGQKRDESFDSESEIATPSLRPLFPKVEFESRHERLRQAMKEIGINAVVASAPVNIFWACGYLGSSSHRKKLEFIQSASYPWVIIPQSSDPVLVANAAAILSYEKGTTISRIFTHHPTADRGPVLIEALKKEHFLPSGSGSRIGFDFGDYEWMLAPQ